MKNLNHLLIAIAFLIFTVSCSQKNQVPDEAPETQAAIHEVASTADEALAMLKSGNARFIADKLINIAYSKQIEASKEHQTPHSVILTCMDSRVPPEIIFDQGIGNIFVVRNAGNLEDENVLGSLEYAVKFAGSKLIVVMGHSHCGAVKGAIQNAEAGHLTQLLNQIKPSIPADTVNSDIYKNTELSNVRTTINDIVSRSSIIKEYLTSNQIKIAGAYYDIETGLVTFLEY